MLSLGGSLRQGNGRHDLQESFPRESSDHSVPGAQAAASPAGCTGCWELRNRTGSGQAVSSSNSHGFFRAELTSHRDNITQRTFPILCLTLSTTGAALRLWFIKRETEARRGSTTCPVALGISTWACWPVILLRADRTPSYPSGFKPCSKGPGLPRSHAGPRER